VEIENRTTGQRRTVECDTLVLTGDWIPDHELARSAGLDLDPGTKGPPVDTALRTSRPGVFAAGNVLHAADTADIAALDGRHVAEHVRLWLRGHTPGRRPPYRSPPTPRSGGWPGPAEGR
jgi:NADPH-dependent 2,4-dienoyl-CoA reductase/sulfur reductase-like enzyme